MTTNGTMSGTITEDGASVDIAMTVRVCHQCHEPLVIRNGIIRQDAKISLVGAENGNPGRLEITAHAIGCRFGPR